MASEVFVPNEKKLTGANISMETCTFMPLKVKSNNFQTVILKGQKILCCCYCILGPLLIVVTPFSRKKWSQVHFTGQMR